MQINLKEKQKEAHQNLVTYFVHNNFKQKEKRQLYIPPPPWVDGRTSEHLVQACLCLALSELIMKVSLSGKHNQASTRESPNSKVRLLWWYSGKQNLTVTVKRLWCPLTHITLSNSHFTICYVAKINQHPGKLQRKQQTATQIKNGSHTLNTSAYLTLTIIYLVSFKFSPNFF